MERPNIKEIIVVEGRDDTAASLRAVEAATIETHGFGIAAATWEKLDRAYEGPGLILFTDPDHAGEAIRRRLRERYPKAQEAFLDRDKATEKGDIGIENAAPEDIQEALEKARCTVVQRRDVFAMTDLDCAGLTGGPGAKARRAALGDALGIGYGNAKALLDKLNRYGISREAFEKALEERIGKV